MKYLYVCGPIFIIIFVLNILVGFRIALSAGMSASLDAMVVMRLAAHPFNRVIFLLVEDVNSVQELLEGGPAELRLEMLLTNHLNLKAVLAHGDDALIDMLHAFLLGERAELVIEVLQQGLTEDLAGRTQWLGLVVQNAPNFASTALGFSGDRPCCLLDFLHGLDVGCLASELFRGQVLLLGPAPLGIH